MDREQPKLLKLAWWILYSSRGRYVQKCRCRRGKATSYTKGEPCVLMSRGVLGRWGEEEFGRRETDCYWACPRVRIVYTCNVDAVVVDEPL